MAKAFRTPIFPSKNAPAGIDLPARYQICVGLIVYTTRYLFHYR